LSNPADNGLCDIAPNVHALAMVGQFITFCRNVSPVNEQKVEILFCCSTEYFQPEPLLNNQQKAHEMHVTPSYSPMRMLSAFQDLSAVYTSEIFLSLKQ